jgi:hypothetical protein
MRGFRRGISLDRDAARVRSGFRHIIGELHPEKVVHVRTEGLFDAQSHFRRAALPCRRSESVAWRTFKISAFDTVRPRASMTSVLIRSPGWGGLFMGIADS